MSKRKIEDISSDDDGEKEKYYNSLLEEIKKYREELSEDAPRESEEYQKLVRMGKELDAIEELRRIRKKLKIDPFELLPQKKQ